MSGRGLNDTLDDTSHPLLHMDGGEGEPWVGPTRATEVELERVGRGGRRVSKGKGKAGAGALSTSSSSLSGGGVRRRNHRQGGAGVGDGVDLGHLHTRHRNAQDGEGAPRSRARAIANVQPEPSTVKGTAMFISKYLYRSNRRECGGWAVGVFTVFLVVWIVTLLQNNIVKSNFIFVRLSEDQVGEIDMLVTPSPSNTSATFFLNQTDIDAKLADSELTRGAVPRWYLLGSVRNRDEPEKEAAVTVVVLETKTEERLGLGRGWTHRVLGEGEAHLSASVLRTIDIDANRGDRVELRIDLGSLASSFGGDDLGDQIGDLVDILNGGVSLDTLGGLAGLDPNALIGNVTEDTIADFLIGIGVNTANTTLVDPALLAGLIDPDAVDGALNTTVNVGDGMTTGGLLDILGTFLEVPGVDVTNETIALNLEYAIVDGIDAPGGKYPAALGNVILVEMEFVEKFFKDLAIDLATNPLLGPAFLPTLGVNDTDDAVDAINSISLRDQALTVIVLYEHREVAYFEAEDVRKQHFVNFTNEVIESLGLSAGIEVSLPVLSALNGTEFIALFLSQLFRSVMIVLALLGCMLIYSLLLTDVEQSTYTYGMLRAIGMPQNRLIGVLVSQALTFAIPGILFAMIFAILTDIPITVIISNYAIVTPNFGLIAGAVVLGVGMGLGMPLISNVVPIQRALSKTLRDSLDIYHQVVSETTVRIQRLESVGLSAWQTALALMMVVVGVTVYYVIPLSFTLQLFALFLSIMNFILLGLVGGLAMISQSIQPYFQRAFLQCLLCGKNRRLIPLIRKNLAGHARRNKKTALMFTVSLSFLVFAGALFTLQSSLIIDSVQQFIGADIVVQTFRYESPLDEVNMRDLLTRAVANESDTLVRDFTFQAFEFDDVENVGQTQLSNLALYRDERVNIYGLEANYLDSTFLEYFIPTEIADVDMADTRTGQPDVVRSLYEQAGETRLPIEGDGDIRIPPVMGSSPIFSNAPDKVAADLEADYLNYFDVIISEAFRDVASVDTSTPIVLKTDLQNPDTGERVDVFRLGKIRAMVKKMAGFFFSSYRQTVRGSPVLVTMDAYQALLDEVHNFTQPGVEGLPTVPPKGLLKVLMDESANLTQVDDVINSLRNFITDDTTLVLNVPELLTSTATATNSILLFFYVVSALNSIMSFFLLLLSFTANINESSYELGILRAVGLSARQVVFVYMVEALALTLSCIVLGTIVGVLSATTLSLQFNLFTESPFRLEFPWALYFTVVGMSLLLSTVGSYLPARPILKQGIAEVMKG